MSNKTKKLIAETLLSMAQHKNLDKITVTDLVEACGISRQTFYYHFQDILDVIEWTIGQAVQNALERSLAAKTPEEATRNFVLMAIQHHELLDKMVFSQKRDQVERLVIQGVRTYLQELARRIGPNSSMSLYDPEVVLNFYTYGITGVLLNNCGKTSVDVDHLSKQLCQLFEGLDGKGR